jgi:hypothetical protein
MNKNKTILFILAAAALYFSFRPKKKSRTSIEIPPHQTFTDYIMTAGSVIYDNKQKSNVLQVFRGGEKVGLIKDYGDMKYVNYLRQDGRVVTGYVKTIDIRK